MGIKQSKLESVIEIGIGTITGMVMAFSIVQILEPFMAYQMPVADNILLTTVLTVVSLIRKYVIRRFFARELHKVVHTFVRNLIIEKDVED